MTDPRIAEFFNKLGIGAVNDPVGFLLANHETLAWERNRYKTALREIAAPLWADGSDAWALRDVGRKALKGEREAEETILELHAEIERLREALEIIARETDGPPVWVNVNRWNTIARAALKGE